MNMKHLYKSNDNKIFSGILGGFGEYYNIDPVLLRSIFVIKESPMSENRINNSFKVNNLLNILFSVFIICFYYCFYIIFCIFHEICVVT